jgi:hypothetical protein
MSDPSTIGTAGGEPPGPGRGRAVAIALGVAAALLAVVLIAVVATRGGGSSSPTGVGTTTTTAAVTTTSVAPSTTAAAAATTTTNLPAPASVLAADDQKLVLLDSATGRAVRTLFDLGPSQPTDREPPSIRSAALSADGQTAFFDVVAETTATMKRVPTRGGTADDLGAGRAPTPSPNGAVLAYLRTNPGHADSVVLRGIDGTEHQSGLGGDDVSACGSVAWSPDSRRVAVDLCTNGEPTTVAEIDVPSAKATILRPPATVRWIAPAYRPDGVLTLAEDRDGDAVVVTVVDGKATGQPILRRDRTTITCLDWDRGTSLLFCEADGSIWVDPADADAHVVGTGYHVGAW